MSTMIPIIWIVELDLLEGRITNGNETTVTPIPSNSGVSYNCDCFYCIMHFFDGLGFVV